MNSEHSSSAANPSRLLHRAARALRGPRFLVLSVSGMALAFGLCLGPSASASGMPATQSRAEQPTATSRAPAMADEEKPSGEVVRVGDTRGSNWKQSVVKLAKRAHKAVLLQLAEGKCSSRSGITSTMDGLLVSLEALEAGEWCCADCGPGSAGATLTCTGCTDATHKDCESNQLAVDCTGNSVESGQGAVSCY